MQQFRHYYKSLFVSACSFSKFIKVNGEPYEIAYWWISFLEGINIASFIMLMKYFIGFNMWVGKIVFIAIVFVPPFIVNYFTFLKRKKYKRLPYEIKTTSMGFIYYMLLTILFFIATGYINIP